jgi:predicted DNA-binding protein (UPF0251 family)
VNTLPRRRCCGLINEVPICQTFIPETKGEGEKVVIQLEELEAVRLKDIKKLEQAECAAAMGLSRQTFQRVLQSARHKIAVALVEARTITIEGGYYVMKNRVFECVECKNVWEVEPCTEGGKHGYEFACPNCGSMNKVKIENGVKHVCGGHGHGHGRGHGCCCGGH